MPVRLETFPELWTLIDQLRFHVAGGTEFCGLDGSFHHGFSCAKAWGLLQGKEEGGTWGMTPKFVNPACNSHASTPTYNMHRHVYTCPKPTNKHAQVCIHMHPDPRINMDRHLHTKKCSQTLLLFPYF